jgi:hypothetical protein
MDHFSEKERDEADAAHRDVQSRNRGTDKRSNGVVSTHFTREIGDSPSPALTFL